METSNHKSVFKMEGRTYFFVCMIFILFLLNVNPVSAHFVCGQVLNSDDNMSSSWFEVRLYYPSNPLDYAICEVSPQDNKYCCDAEAIPPEESWEVGAVVNARVFDSDSGYVAGPVSMTTTGEGYDIMPEMKLEKIITIHEPQSKLIFSNSSEFFLNASFMFPFNNVEIENKGITESLCTSCSTFEGVVPCDFGMNNLKIFANDGSDVFLENLSIAVLKDYNFSRDISCKRCRRGRARAGKVIRIDIEIDLSHEVEDFELKEYVPVDWDIINTTGDGEVQIYSETHDAIVWDISGKTIRETYYVRAPNLWFFPENYIFRTELEGEVLNEQEVMVYRFIKFFPRRYYSSGFLSKNKFQRIISSNKPYVLYPDGMISTLAVFPERKTKSARFELVEDDLGESIPGAVSYYAFKTNLRDDKIKGIYFRYKLNKKEDKDVGLYMFRGSWERYDVEPYLENEDFAYYEVYTDSARGLAFATGKKLLGLF